jgi:hypothetical protein
VFAHERRRGDHDVSLPARARDRDHVFGHGVFQANTRIEALFHDVYVARLASQLDRCIWVAAQKLYDDGPEQLPSPRFAGVEPQQPAGGIPKVVDALERSS